MSSLFWIHVAFFFGILTRPQGEKQRHLNTRSTDAFGPVYYCGGLVSFALEFCLFHTKYDVNIVPVPLCTTAWHCVVYGACCIPVSMYNPCVLGLSPQSSYLSGIKEPTRTLVVLDVDGWEQPIFCKAFWQTNVKNKTKSIEQS